MLCGKGLNKHFMFLHETISDCHKQDERILLRNNVLKTVIEIHYDFLRLPKVN